MKFLLLDNYKILMHTVNSEQEESLLINYENRNLNGIKIVSLEKENDKWYVKSNGVITVFDNGIELDQAELIPNSIYRLQILGSDEELYLYSDILSEKELKYFSYESLNKITIGQDEKNILVYKNKMLNNNHAEIVLKDNIWYINALNNSKVYVNDICVNEKRLELGDIIFLYGLKIVWMGNFFSVGTNFELFKTNSVHIQNYLFEKYPIIETDAIENLDLDLYKEDDYFFHVARLTNLVEEENVKIDQVPQAKEIEERPLLLTLGSSLTLMVSSFYNTYRAINGVLSGDKTWAESIPTLIMSGAMIFGSLIMPRIISMYQKHQIKLYQKKRKKKYTKYLEQKEDEILGILSKQAQMLRENNVSLEKCAENILRGKNNIWERELIDEDFLNVSLGVGNVPSSLKIQAPEEHFTLEEDELEKLVFEVVNKSRVLNNVPVIVNLIEKRIVSVINDKENYEEYIKSIILQLVSHYSPNDLKIAFFTDEDGNEKWSDIKYFPHLWNSDKSVRFFSSNVNERKKVSNYFEEIIKERKEQLALDDLKESDKEEYMDKELYKGFDSYYLIICDNYSIIKDIPIIEDIIESTKNYGFSFLIFEKSLKRVPNYCSDFVYLNNDEGVLFDKKINDKRQITFKPDIIHDLNLRMYANALANIPVIEGEGKYELPTSLSFLEMYGVSKIEQLNILNKWNTNNPTQTLATPIGVHKNGDLFMLDLHEKCHGPHGLIAGSTGSGKSEFIISFITSMAINFHPNDVQFVLIDYKGGGLAGAFENRETGMELPHLAGTITNLDVSEMNRTLVSIKSELQRRQKKFSEVKDQLGESTIDIYKYQKFYKEGLIKEPIAHLFIISDEFAELKAQQPDFMQELISTARIGRSLGVHLILATQKPSGVVNDQIWSNSKFKICLKVADRADSMEMLKKPDAASIKEAGRFYLQVGYDEYFDIGQSGYSGAKYVPSDKVSKKNDDSVNFVDNVGNIYKSINSVAPIIKTEEKGDQLTNLVKYLVALGEKEKIKIRKMWLDAIPEKIWLADLTKKYNYKSEPYVINPIIGEYDDPKHQMQGVLTLDITNNGNTLIWGTTGSGKENLISTIMFSIIATHAPQEVNMFVIDCGAESLRSFRKMPHVGDIAFVDDSEKILNMLIMIEKEYEKRKELFADYAGSYNNYLKNTGEKLPQIMILINNYDVFLENYYKLGEGLSVLFRDSFRYGIYFVISCINTSTIKAKQMQYFNNKIALKMPDPSDYRTLLGADRSLVPANYFGRGIVKLEDGSYEFQTAMYTEIDNMNNYLKQVSEQLMNAYKYKVRGIPVMPEKVTIDFLASEIKDLSNIPIGVNKNTLEIEKFNFKNEKVIPVLSNNNIMLIDFIHPIAKMMATLPNTKVKIIDPTLTYKTLLENVEYIDSNFDNEIENIVKSLKSGYQTIYIFVGVSMLYRNLNSQSKEIFSKFIENFSKFPNNYVIISDLYENFKTVQMETWANKYLDKSNALWLGPGVGTQMSIQFSDLSVEERKEEFKDMCFANINNKAVLIKNVVEDEVLENEK